MHSLMHSVFNQVWKVSKIFCAKSLRLWCFCGFVGSGLFKTLDFHLQIRNWGVALCRQGQQVGCHESDPTPGATQNPAEDWFYRMFFPTKAYPFGGQDHFRKYANREAETAGFVSLRELFVQLMCEIWCPSCKLDFFSLNRIGIPWGATHKAKWSRTWEVSMTWCNTVNLCEPQISWGAQHQVEALQKAAGLRDQAGRVLDIIRSGDVMEKKGHHRSQDPESAAHVALLRDSFVHKVGVVVALVAPEKSWGVQRRLLAKFAI